MHPRFKKAYDFGQYVSLMSLASGLSLIRGFVIAGILDAASFGIYATVVATGMFFSSIVSFGETEKTIKLFPRLWVEGRYNNVIQLTDQAVGKLITRVILVTYLLFGSLMFGVFRNGIKDAFLIILVAMNAAITGIFASAIRSTGKTNILSRNTLVRAVLVLFFATIGAMFLNWHGALLGEALGFIFGSLLTRVSLKSQAKHAAAMYKVKSNNSNIMTHKSNKYWLFFATLCVSVPVFLDRAFVSLIYDNLIVGTQGFLMLFVAGASTVTGIIGQKVGPQLIKMQHNDVNIKFQIKYWIRWILFIWAILITGLIIAGLLLSFGFFSFYYEKFQLDVNLLIATFALCLMQISAITDYLIISRNAEIGVFLSAFGYLFAICTGGFSVWWFKLPLTSFIWMLAGSKFVHLVMQVIVISWIFFKEKNNFSQKFI